MKTICICGGGSLGHVVAGWLSSRKHAYVNILTNHPEKWSENIVIDTPEGSRLYGEISNISNNPADVIPSSDVILLCLPGFLIKKELIRIKPFISNRAFIGSVFSSTGFFFEAKEIFDEKQPLWGFQRVPFISRVNEYGKSAHLLGFKDEYKIGVMEADIDSDVDARAIEEAGAKSIQLHTGGMCHLDAGMTKQGLDSFGATDYEFVVLENVGNLVCPAEFDTGASKNAMILSVPEGDDKPLKYPLMFSVCDCVLINKIDTKSVFDFDDAAVVDRIKKINPTAEIFFVSAKTGEGMDNWFNWLRRQIDDWNKD